VAHLESINQHIYRSPVGLVKYSCLSPVHRIEAPIPIESEPAQEFDLDFRLDRRQECKDQGHWDTVS